MARDLESGSSQYLEYAGAVLAAEPISVSAWIKPESAATATAVFSLGVNGGVARHTLVHTSLSTIQAASTNSGGSGGQSTSAGTAPVGSWTQVGAMFGSSSSRKAVRNGVIATENTTALTISGLNRTLLGARYNTTLGAYFDGVVAEVGVWDVELTQAEWTALSKGISPLAVRPANLVAYWPLFGGSSPEPNRLGSGDMTVTGATQADHPPILYLSAARVGLSRAPANSGGGPATAVGSAVGEGYQASYGSGSATATGSAQGHGYAPASGATAGDCWAGAWGAAWGLRWLAGAPPALAGPSAVFALVVSRRYRKVRVVAPRRGIRVLRGINRGGG